MINLIDYGFLPGSITENTEGIPARITAVHKERYALVCEYGETYGRLKTSVYYGSGYEDFPTTGDFVRIVYNSSGDSQIMQTLARKTFFSRREAGTTPRDQAVAANFDYVFIMQSLNHDSNINRLERYLTLAWKSNAVPVVVLTKADLTEEHSEQMQRIETVSAGARVHVVSAKTGYGIDTLSGYLQPGKTIVFLGSSGVGKSSLVNALAEEEIMEVSGIREEDSRGRHTTTHRQLVMLKSGVMIIDTPGMRELGMWDVSNGLGEAFFDVEQYLGSCKFSNCKHQTEPGCAIKKAIENGELPQTRWENYIKLKNEAKFSDNKTAYRKQKEQWHKGISKELKQMKKEGRF